MQPRNASAKMGKWRLKRRQGILGRSSKKRAERATWIVAQVQDEPCHIIFLALAQQGCHLARGSAGHIVHA